MIVIWICFSNFFEINSNKISKLNLNWVNRFIRRTNLDELPQLFNILRGDMSFVGPRPAILSQKSLIDCRKKNNVLLFRPGVTGLAQILSFDGMSDYELSMEATGENAIYSVGLKYITNFISRPVIGVYFFCIKFF